VATVGNRSASVSPKLHKVTAELRQETAAVEDRNRKSTETGNGSPEDVSRNFAAALAMIATLPLNENEKVDAVRRLLAMHEALI